MAGVHVWAYFEPFSDELDEYVDYLSPEKIGLSLDVDTAVNLVKVLADPRDTDEYYESLREALQEVVDELEKREKEKCSD